MERNWPPPPVKCGWFRYKCPDCNYKWWPSRWDKFFYPLHYFESHLGGNAFRNPFTEGT